MPTEKSPHILSASANLVGFSLVVLSLLKSLDLPQVHLIGKMASVCTAIFALSCAFSFLSIRMMQKKNGRSVFYENVADYIFFSGLLLLSFISIVVAFDVIAS